MKKTPYKIIGIAGHAGAGKDTVAEYLTQKYGVAHHSFAANLKAACAAAFNLPVFFFNEEPMKSQDDHKWLVSPRKIAQFVGTELFRDSISKLCPHLEYGFWVESLRDKLDALITASVVSISDVRFQDEANWIMNSGGILIRLTRDGADGKVGISGHASESGFDVSSYPAKRVFNITNNSTKEELYAQLNPIIREYLDVIEPIDSHIIETFNLN